jgi:formylglycine-generating enzyme required for sulfatase activity
MVGAGHPLVRALGRNRGPLGIALILALSVEHGGVDAQAQCRRQCQAGEKRNARGCCIRAKKPRRVTAISVRGNDRTVRGADVFIDGEKRGQAPLFVKVAAGRHLVEVQKDGFESFSQWIRVNRGQRRTVIPQLRKEPVAAMKKATVKKAESCPEGMVEVPGGTFRMGSPEGEGDDDEHPQRRVTLSTYCIDRTEVTVAAYARCVAPKTSMSSM